MHFEHKQISSVYT